jgi:hypothetical protein
VCTLVASSLLKKKLCVFGTALDYLTLGLGLGLRLPTKQKRRWLNGSILFSEFAVTVTTRSPRLAIWILVQGPLHHVSMSAFFTETSSQCKYWQPDSRAQVSQMLTGSFQTLISPMAKSKVCRIRQSISVVLIISVVNSFRPGWWFEPGEPLLIRLDKFLMLLFIGLVRGRHGW